MLLLTTAFDYLMERIGSELGPNTHPTDTIPPALTVSGGDCSISIAMPQTRQAILVSQAVGRS